MERRAAKAKRAQGTPKVTGQRIDSGKGPIRDRAHMARVAQQVCLICRLPHPQVHHIRECFPRTMGVRVGDDKTVPLCPTHHAELHMTNTDAFWRRYGVDPVQWAERFYASGK